MGMEFGVEERMVPMGITPSGTFKTGAIRY